MHQSLMKGPQTVRFARSVGPDWLQNRVISQTGPEGFCCVDWQISATICETG